MQNTSRIASALVIAAAAVMGLARAQTPQHPSLGYSDTPMLPGGKWHVHDGARPQPTIVTPGTFSTEQTPGTPPSDAMVVAAGTGAIRTKDEFGDCQLHVEWSAPSPPKGTGQERGNSGVFLMSRYEIQVLDSYEAQTYPDGQAAAIYGQFPPLVNASRKPGEWQVYDIVFTAPRFNGATVAVPATATVFHNGIIVHNRTELIGSTVHRALGKYDPHPPKAPLMLQDHSHPVRYRNIWIRTLKSYDE